MELFENLRVVFFVLLALAAVAGLGVALWKPLLRRAWRYFVIWWERDKIADAEAKRLRECRQRAEAEVSGDADAMCRPPITADNATAAAEREETKSEPVPQFQKVQR